MAATENEPARRPDAHPPTRILSVVVPAYNEQDSLAECLDRLTGQLEHICEIVVVDNNSTDGTAALIAEYAARFREIVPVTETRQGLVFARNTGLDTARGELIARIDSDTRVPEHWAESIVEFFAADTENRWAALCGRGEAYDLPYGDRIERLKNRFSPFGDRSKVAGAAAAPPAPPRESPVLYGSNMILRRQTWARIRESVSMRRDVFEDVDTGLCVQEAGGRNAFLASITVGVSARRMESSLPSFLSYMICLPRTLLLHRRWALAAGAALLYLPGVTVLHSARLLVIRAYDRDTDSFSVRALLDGRRDADRVLP